MMSENTTTTHYGSARLPNWVWISLFLLAVGAYLAGLDMPLVGPDEPRYSQVAREMFDRADLVTPTLGGYHWFEKPALLYWLQIGAYSLLGVNEFAARIGSALFGMGTVISLGVLGRSFDKRSGTDNFGLWLTLIAASTVGIVVFAHGASFDIIVTFPLTAALVSFMIFDQSRGPGFRERTLPLIAFYFFIGLAVLAKGLIGIVFPFAIVAFYHLLSWKLPSRAFILSIFWGTLLSVGVAATWYWPMYTRHGWEFIDQFFLQHHFQRFTSNKYQHPQPFYFFIWVLPLMTIPWLPFFGAAVVRTVKGILNRDPSNDSAFPGSSQLLVFSWSWILVPLVFFSLSGSKLPGYILPAVPPAVILTAVYIYKLVGKSTRWRTAISGVAALTFIALIGAALIAAPWVTEHESVKSLIRAADERGHSSYPILMFQRITHNAEFYAAGRLIRDKDGKQHRIATIEELTAEVRSAGGKAVVMVPNERLVQLTAAAGLRTEVIRNNDEFTITFVSHSD